MAMGILLQIFSRLDTACIKCQWLAPVFTVVFCVFMVVQMFSLAGGAPVLCHVLGLLTDAPHTFICVLKGNSTDFFTYESLKVCRPWGVALHM